MAPALTKFLKDGHGIHLSSPPALSEQSVMGVTDMDSQLRPSEDLQKMLLSVLPTLDSYLQTNPLELPSSTGHSGSLVPPSMDSSAKSYNITLREPHLAPFLLPGASDMRFLPEHNDHRRYKSACQCRPGARDVHLLCTLSNVSPRFENGDYSSLWETTLSSNQGNCRLNQLVPNVELQSQIKKRVSRQTGLHSRAHRLQRRLEAVLGQHAVLHCDQQLEGLRTPDFLCHGGLSADSEPSQWESQQCFPRLQAYFTEIKEFSQCSRAVLKGLGESLDSEATASSSSDDEPLKTKAPSECREPRVASPCFERKWLEERAELGSRWSWLQLRLTELDGRIQQLMKLHKNICSTKGRVVLGDSQPMTARQMKNALLREVAGLSCSALDVDNEPCSPTRLLHNIERQSAQLSQIVNSLMLPLNLSPLSKPPQPWKDKEVIDRSSKRRKFGVRRTQLFRDDLSCVCARTRPLVTFHKRRLFVLNSVRNNSSLKCSSTHSDLTSCFCSNCSSSSEPGLVCSDPDSSSNGTLSSKTCTSICSGSTLFRCSTKASAREEWSQTPLVINALPLSPLHYRRHSSTPLYNSHKCKHYSHHHKRIQGLSPIQPHCGLQREDIVHPKKSKRRRRNRFTEDEDYALSHWEGSSDEIFQENFVLVTHKQNTARGAARKRHGETMFDIDNIVIPASLTKVEKLQYKDILTPSWQVLKAQSFLKHDTDSKNDSDEEFEIVTDEVFAQRHLPLEQKEKMRWSFWRKRHCRHSLRSGSRPSHSVGELLTSGEDNSVEWSFTQLDTDEQLSSGKCLPQNPWEQRVFPLNDDEETALSSEVLQWCSDSPCTLSSSTILNSDLTSSLSTHTTLPSGGQYMDCIDSGN